MIGSKTKNKNDEYIQTMFQSSLYIHFDHSKDYHLCKKLLYRHVYSGS